MLLAAIAQFGVCGQVIELDFQKSAGVIRPLHGVNGGPLCYRGTVDFTPYHRALRIPVTRLHDVPWVNAEAVDIHFIFPDFRADPERAGKLPVRGDRRLHCRDHQCAVADRLPAWARASNTRRGNISSILPPTPRNGRRYALGSSATTIMAGRAGFEHGIRYWEIWNEPDVRPNMWTGTDEQFFELYATAAKAIKTAFPEVSVGGPAVGGTGEFKGEPLKHAPFVGKFLAFCREHQAPLDFFSWHRYTSPAVGLAAPRSRHAPSPGRARLHPNREPLERVELFAQ